jgi:hypothetical protein
MGLEQIVIGGETMTFFNIAEEMIYLRDLFFNLITNYAAGFIVLILMIWTAVFFIAIMVIVRKQTQAIGGR